MVNLIERSMKINPMVSVTTFCLTRHASDRLTVAAAGLSHEPGMSCPNNLCGDFYSWFDKRGGCATQGAGFCPSEDCVLLVLSILKWSLRRSPDGKM